MSVLIVDDYLKESYALKTEQLNCPSFDLNIYLNIILNVVY